MPQSLASVYVHVIFSTKNRISCIDQIVRQELHRYTATVLKNIECHAVRIGGVSDHLHVLCRMSKTLSISGLVEEIKVPTSKWLKTKSPALKDFHWQNGYGAFSVSPSHVEDVTTYIDQQDAHHQRRSFQDEFRRFLEKHGVKYDERYVWD
ncbi:MAG: IS200/IS605 family transposase [Candidatus Hydrogenedentes bacterium]|nr:IS200/IS605 family transposase [Candidatus Hydrogenedentota bacterium]